MQQQVRVARFLERGTERGDQLVRQIADEAHRVGERNVESKIGEKAKRP